jgi:uncharacterized membrane protein
MRHVVIADFLFTTPTAIIQMISGLRLTYLAGFHFTDRWILWGIILYSFAGACWLPVVWMQIKMRDIADIAFKQQKLLPEYYWKMSFYWNLLGCLAFPAIVIVFWLMVMKPTL